MNHKATIITLREIIICKYLRSINYLSSASIYFIPIYYSPVLFYGTIAHLSPDLF